MRTQDIHNGEAADFESASPFVPFTEPVPAPPPRDEHELDHWSPFDGNGQASGEYGDGHSPGAVAARFEVETEPYFESPVESEATLTDADHGIELAEVEEAEGNWEAPAAAYEHAVVTFPSGESLTIVAHTVPEGDEHYDPVHSGNPLLDTSGANRAKKLSRNFSVDELARSGGTPFDRARIDPKLVNYLQAIRDHVGASVLVTSGYRSNGYNIQMYREMNKKPTLSRHSSGSGADIKIAGKRGMDIAKVAIDACGPNIGVGIGASYAHVDARGSWARWTYFDDKAAAERAIREIDDYRQARLNRGSSEPRRVPSTPPMPAPTPVVPATVLRRRLMEAARREWERWARGSKHETDPAMRGVLREYWNNVPLHGATADQMIQNRLPWSAAFISWVVTQAGAGAHFRRSAAHYVYIASAKRNRQLANHASPFWAYRSDERLPEVGDIVCKARKTSAGCSAVTYETVDNGTVWATHGDVVVDTRPGEVVVIGGNLDNSVKEKRIALAADGRLPQQGSDGCRFFAIISVRDGGSGA